MIFEEHVENFRIENAIMGFTDLGSTFEHPLMHILIDLKISQIRSHFDITLAKKDAPKRVCQKGY